MSLYLTTEWNKAFDMGLDNYFTALNIAGDFDRGLVSKMKRLEVDANFLQLINNYLDHCTLHVVINGQT